MNRRLFGVLVSLGLAMSGVTVVTPVVLAQASPSAAAGEPIVIGVSTALSGGAADIGESERKGAELAVEQINLAGGIAGRPLALRIEDNACDPTQGANTFTKLAGEPDVVAIIGALCSSVTLAGMPIVQREEVPLIVGISSATAITEQSGVGGNEWTFRINPSDSGLAEALGNYLAAGGTTQRVAILGEESDYGRGGAAALKSALEPKGIETTSSDFVTKDTPDFSTVLARYASERPDAVALYIIGADHLSYVTQAKSFGLDIPVTGRTEFYDPSLPVLLSGGFEGSTSAVPYSDAVDTPENAAFVEAYVAKNGTAPTAESYAGYKEVMVIADALARAPSVDRTAVREALETTSLPSLLGGTISFDQNNQAHDKAVVLEIRGNEILLGGTADS